MLNLKSCLFVVCGVTGVTGLNIVLWDSGSTLYYLYWYLGKLYMCVHIHLRWRRLWNQVKTVIEDDSLNWYVKDPNLNYIFLPFSFTDPFVGVSLSNPSTYTQLWAHLAQYEAQCTTAVDRGDLNWWPYSFKSVPLIFIPQPLQDGKICSTTFGL